MKNKRKYLALILLILLVIILGVLSIIFFKNLKQKSEKDYVAEFTKMGEEFYSSYYYKIISVNKTDDEVKKFLSTFSTMGLKIDLNELEKYNDDYKNVIENFANAHKDCKKDETMVIIYPKSPYSNLDFSLSVKFECDYKNSSK